MVLTEPMSLPVWGSVGHIVRDPLPLNRFRT